MGEQQQTEYGEDVFAGYTDGAVLETVVRFEHLVGSLFEQATLRFAELGGDTAEPAVETLLNVDKLDALMTSFRLCLVAELELDARAYRRDTDPALD